MENTKPAPKVFVSHSHAEKSIAEDVARGLRERGVEAWLDKWEIQPGDSLIQKIFNEGLGGCAVFLILLSPESVTSKWVREELDIALVRRLEGVTRVIPIVVRPCEIPIPLRALLWLDLATSGVDSTTERIADVAFGRTAKPPLGTPPGPTSIQRVEGLSDYASAVAVALAPALAEGGRRAFDGSSLVKMLSLSAQQVNDAIDELAGQGLVRVHKFLGTQPFTFGMAEPTYALALQLRGTPVLDYDPEDVRVVAAAIAALNHASGQQLVERVALSPARLNHAVSYLNDYGHIRVLRALGTAPFDFRHVDATGATRRFVEKHGR